jgi:hypothetical protein
MLSRILLANPILLILLFKPVIPLKRRKPHLCQATEHCTLISFVLLSTSLLCFKRKTLSQHKQDELSWQDHTQDY